MTDLGPKRHRRCWGRGQLPLKGLLAPNSEHVKPPFQETVPAPLSPSSARARRASVVVVKEAPKPHQEVPDLTNSDDESSPLGTKQLADPDHVAEQVGIKLE
jgi:hypothetical protein